MNTIYAREDYLGADEYIDVVNKSGLNRPVGDRGRVERMLAHANLILTARQDGRLVGFARSLTDFCFCCYLSDLAVAKAYQRQGIGRRLVDEVRRAIGEEAMLLLIAAPGAVAYYPKLGFSKSERAYVLQRTR